MSEENKTENEQVLVDEGMATEVKAMAEPVNEEMPTCEQTQPIEDITASQYHWSYHDQRAFDTKKSTTSRKKGVLLYAAVMTAAFLTCFGILLGTVVWYGGENDDWYTIQPFSTAEVFDYVAPTTVFIQSHRSNTLLGNGTGFFIRSDGYILTNYHVVKGATQIKVYRQSGASYVASLIGYDQDNDLAVLKINGEGFPVPAFGDSDQVRIGETAIAIGHPGGAGGAWSVTEGIISALNRKVLPDDGGSSAKPLTAIQFDAIVNHGNSGGPLCNAYGEVIGIVTLKSSDLDGVGYAIPINHAFDVIDKMIGG